MFLGRQNTSRSNYPAYVGTREGTSTGIRETHFRVSRSTNCNDTSVEYRWFCTRSRNCAAWRKGRHGMHGGRGDSDRRTLQRPVASTDGRAHSGSGNLVWFYFKIRHLILFKFLEITCYHNEIPQRGTRSS